MPETLGGENLGKCDCLRAFLVTVSQFQVCDSALCDISRTQ